MDECESVYTPMCQKEKLSKEDEDERLMKLSIEV